MLSYALPPSGTPGVPPPQSPPVVPLEVPTTPPTSDAMMALQLELAKSSCSPGAESEVDTPASDRTDKSSKGSQIVSGKVIANGAKPTVPLKRVSFGSSKGSMVETLIYESPLHEEPEPSPIQEAPPSPFVTDASATSTPQQQESEPSQKVRVSFFESSRPQPVPGDGPEAFSAPDALLPLRLDAAAAAAMATPSLDPNTPGPIYVRQGSTDSGWDNPFRPDGDLSREADEIVELIKGGKPITPTPNSAAAAAEEAATIIGDATDAGPEQRNGSAKVNGAAPKANATPLGAGANSVTGGSPSGPVDVHRATVAPAADVEHVVLKKKPKCKCCVIQ